LGLSTSTNKGDAPPETTISTALLRATRARTAILLRAALQDIELRESGHSTWCAMLTLTYAPGREWSPSHIRRLNWSLRKRFQRRGHAYRYVWCAELQRRGAVHFHQLVWMPPGYVLPYVDREGLWTHGMSRVERARNAVPYLAKYASKLVGGIFPRGLRLSGAGGLDARSREHVRYALLPSFVRKLWPMGTSIARYPGGGFVNLETGEVARSEWEYSGRVPGYVKFRRVVSPPWKEAA
jgi:hypothetical protein